MATPQWFLGNDHPVIRYQPPSEIVERLTELLGERWRYEVSTSEMQGAVVIRVRKSPGAAYWVGVAFDVPQSFEFVRGEWSKLVGTVVNSLACFEEEKATCGPVNVDADGREVPP